MRKEYHGLKSLTLAYSEKTGKTIRESEETVKDVLDCLTNLLLDDTKDGVQIIDNLTLHRTKISARTGYNFQTKESVMIPEKTTIKLKIGKSLVQKLNTK